LEENAAALADEKHEGTEVDLGGLAKDKQAQLPAEAKPAADAGPATAADAGPAAKAAKAARGGDASPEAH
jgi:hypothetical protein